MIEAAWDDDYAQFTRLLTEIAAVADLSAEQIQAIADSTDLEPHEVHELFIRAEREFEDVKRRKKPVDLQSLDNKTEQTIEITIALQATGCVDQQLLDHLGTQAETWFRTLQHEGMVTPSDPASAERYEQTALELASVDSRALSEPTKALTE